MENIKQLCKYGEEKKKIFYQFFSISDDIFISLRYEAFFFLSMMFNINFYNNQ